ncbi:MATH and LRR domain-containing protein PFE0570w-like [Chelonus insularis]|uniref:MATH and LRR domain-containing protein PFE0570w-like n=1 Tax=Chelonus insularis TaxID=460826 RepID=UPI00158E3FB7|nr:MATH and LRR domain-containing protein PFE0570w-like [Chelonus insularis]
MKSVAYPKLEKQAKIIKTIKSPSEKHLTLYSTKERIDKQHLFTRRHNVANLLEAKESRENNQTNTNITNKSLMMLKQEINGWKKQKTLSKQVENKLYHRRIESATSNIPEESIHHTSPVFSVHHSNETEVNSSYLNERARKDVGNTIISSSTQAHNRDEQMEENMITREYYSDLHSPEECSKSLNNSSDTWEALENAEKLLQKARKNIMKSTYDVPWLDLTLNRASSSDLDEIDSKVRQRVITKLQEVNKPKLCEKQIFFSEDQNVLSSESPKDKNVISGRQMEINKTYQSSVKLVETCRKCSEEKIRNKLNEKCKLEALKQVKNGKVETRTSTETINSNSSTRNKKTQLPVRNIKKCSLISNSCDNFTKKKVKTLRASSVRNESSKQKKYDEILIDKAVQTSFKDQVIEETASLLKDREQNQLRELTDKEETRPLKMLNSPKNSEEFQIIMKNDHETKTRDNDISNVKNVKEGELKENFVKFLCQISNEFENPVEILSNSPKNLNAYKNSEISDNKSWYEEFCNEWETEEIDLYSPNLVNLDKILCNLDKNMEKIIEDTNKLETLFTEAKSYNKPDETANKIDNRDNINDESFLLDERSINLHEQVNFTDTLPKNPINLRNNHENELSDGSDRSKTSDEMKFILEPKSRISSYESVSSDVFYQQARFSTPLNNYKNIEVSHHHHVNKKNVDINCCDHKKHSITEQKSNVDVNIDVKNDVNVFITRNQLSSISCEEKNSELTKEKIVDSQKEKNKDLKSTLVEKFNEKSDCSNISENNDTDDQQHNIISNSVEHLSSNSPINSHHVSISNNNKKSNPMNEIAEKHHQEQSEKSVADDKITKHDHSSEGSDSEMAKGKNEADENNLRINKVERNNKLTPASSKNDTHNRTSYDISAIYSENFEDSVTEIKSILKEHDTDKSKSYSSEKKIERNNNDNIENRTLTENESEKILSYNIKNTNIDLEINEMSKSISLHVKIDENPSNKFEPKSSLADTSDKSLEKNNNDMEDKLFSSTSISRSSSRKSISSSISNSKKLKINKIGLSSSEDFSEGEIHVPESCSYSIGEIKIPKSQLEELTKYNEILFRENLHSSSGSYSFGEIRIPESSKQLKKKNSSQTQSCGEILDTDVELTSSLESPGEIK